MPKPILLRLLSALALAAAAHAGTSRAHIIGDYALHNLTALVGDPTFCPRNLSTQTFTFEARPAPSRLRAPAAFNILVRHTVTSLDGRACQSSGAINVLESGHPFAADPPSILEAWSRGGWGSRSRWVSETFIAEVAKQDWNVGYDFVERSCVDVRLRGGVGFLWFQPGWDLVIGNAFQMRGGTKFLLFTFQGKPKATCVYTSLRVGGEDGLSVGPVSDPTNGGSSSPPPVTEAPPGTDPPTQPGGSGDGGGGDNGSGGGGSDGGGSGGSGGAEAPPVFQGDSAPGQNDSEGSEGSEGSKAACFPASARVELADGTTRPVSELRVGDRVRAAPGPAGHSDVFFFSHRTPADGARHEFVALRTAPGAVVTLSPGHYVRVGGRLVAAGKVCVGDVLTLANGGDAEVVDVERVMRGGKYAPHTLQGDIIVDGVLVSTYTTAVHPRFAHHVLLVPLRWLYRVGFGRFFDGVLDSGAETLRSVMPKGPDVLEVSV